MRKLQLLAACSAFDLVKAMRNSSAILVTAFAAHFFLFSAMVRAATSISSIEPTQSEAIVRVQTDQPGNCTYRASRGFALGTNIPDISDNGNTDARVGSVVAVASASAVGQGPGQHVFHLGAHKSNDALAADADYIVGVTCGSDSEVTSRFHTRPIPWGSTAIDIVPFNSNHFGNMDHPLIDWNATAAPATFCDPASHSYCDPNTGAEYWVATKPGWIQPNWQLASVSNAMGPAVDVNGGKWTNLQNIITNGSTYATSPNTSGSSDYAFIPLKNFGCPGLSGGMSGFAGAGCTIDDIVASVYCGSASAVAIRLQLGYKRTGPIGNVITTGNCAASDGLLGYFPNDGVHLTAPFAQPFFKAWGHVPQRNHVVPATGAVSVNNGAVSLTSGGNSQSWFDNDWISGDVINLNGTYYPITGANASSTTLTISSPPPNGSYTYTGVGLGIFVGKTAAVNVDVSIGLNYPYSFMPNQDQGGDVEMTSQAPVSVSKSADGATCGIYTVGCSGGALSPPIKGYLGCVDNGAGGAVAFVFIPYNSDGSPRGESRLLSLLQKPDNSRITTNGDAINYIGTSGPNAMNGCILDDSDGTTFYSSDNSSRLFKWSYNEAYGGACTGYQTYIPYPTKGAFDPASGPGAAQDCFKVINTTPSSTGHDLLSQITGPSPNYNSGAYQTGLNYQNTSVGPAHSGFGLGWLTVNNGRLNGPAPSNPAPVEAGIYAVALGWQNGPSIEAGFADDGTGNGTFVLKSIRDTWSEPNLRWATVHSSNVFSMGGYRYSALHNFDDGFTGVFGNSFQAAVSQVNLAGFGSSANWTSNTTIDGGATASYACPNSGFPAYLASLQGSNHCIQVKVSTPFCSHNPNSSYHFPDGKTEAQEFPCSTPGFGVANASYSKLQDIAVGDYVCDKAAGCTNAETMVIVGITYNSATDIDLWLLRDLAGNYQQPAYNPGNNANGPSSACPGLCGHTGPWSLYVVAPGASAVIDMSSPANSWLRDNPYRFAAHAAIGAGSSPGTYTFSQAQVLSQSVQKYIGNSSLAPAQHVNAAFTTLANGGPSFAGAAAVFGNNQSYNNSTSAPGSLPYPTFVDWRFFQNGGVIQNYEAPNALGNAFTAAAIGGTNYTYRINVIGQGNNGDPLYNPGLNYKITGVQGWAGRWWLKDVSSPATFSSAADMLAYSVCIARNSNECVFGSASGQYFISIPRAEPAFTSGGATNCANSVFGTVSPCITSVGPRFTEPFQFRIDTPPLDIYSRQFGMVHSHHGLQYTFSNCRLISDGTIMFCPGYWLDGVRTEWLAIRIGRTPPPDNVNRSQFVPIPISVTGDGNNIRARFGYLDNGGNLLHCTAYAQDCSTEIPSGAATDPYSFTNESVGRKSCTSGSTCTINIPALPNRILYYVVDRLDGSGNVLSTTPAQAIAVP